MKNIPFLHTDYVKIFIFVIKLQNVIDIFDLHFPVMISTIRSLATIIIPCLSLDMPSAKR